MKKIIAIIMVMLIALTSVSCGKDKNETKNEETIAESTESNDNNEAAGGKSEKNSGSDSKETSTNNTKVNGKKSIYKEKLDKIQEGLKDLDSLYKGNTVEMKSAANQEYERWDKALNEIYTELKKDLSKSDMSKLEKEELQWIKDKEDKAKKAAAEFKGGTAENLTYTESLVQSTKERCYELVEKYMK
ncbi:lysozyme inhibitor LprI family protein [Clostridium cibarium]|uniref:DUF1311 domain-containing protein n=1 Tax=Clostridium cibarium TaxID=2762247 RepID=A0ABR8PVE4_9CLOT|nr:lysozyme inhibitor LprI family protein [Clostridium cibarium]MBD7912141.1 DUF1311 domain-containing protein [Clostridium cibarium]